MTTIQENQFEMENVYTDTDNHVYNVVKTTIEQEWEDGYEAGSITLLNQITNELEEFTIWCGNSEGDFFYVCLPTGEFDENDEEILDVTSLEFLGTNLSPFRELSSAARKNATLNFLASLKISFRIPVTFLEAYRTLRNANHVYLYDLDGNVQTDGGNY